MTPSPAKKLMIPGNQYWFWSGDNPADPGKARRLTLKEIRPNTHSQKYRTIDLSGTTTIHDYASFDRPLWDKIFNVLLIKTVSYDDQGEEIELADPILKLEAQIHAVNGLHLWDRLWLNFSAAVKSADTMDAGVLSEVPLSEYTTAPVPPRHAI